jgi:hypothetical protein
VTLKQYLVDVFMLSPYMYKLHTLILFKSPTLFISLPPSVELPHNVHFAFKSHYCHFYQISPATTEVNMEVHQKANNSRALVAYACNPSYSRGKSGGSWFQASQGK